MALLSEVVSDPVEILCSAMHASPFFGMATMYGLMSAAHIGPWLRLSFPRRDKADESVPRAN